MSLKNLIELSKIRKIKRVDAQGREYLSRQVVGADKGHWRIEYCYASPGGYTYEYEWERMTEDEMQASQCFASDYEGPR